MMACRYFVTQQHCLCQIDSKASVGARGGAD